VVINKTKLTIDLIIVAGVVLVCFMLFTAYTHASSLVISPSSASSCENINITDVVSLDFGNWYIFNVDTGDFSANPGGSQSIGLYAGDFPTPICGFLDVDYGNFFEADFSGVLISLPPGNYSLIETDFNFDETFCDTLGDNYTDCINSSAFVAQALFTITLPPMFGIPTDITTGVLANLTDQLSDSGTLTLMTIIAGIIFGFFIIERIIESLKPKDDEVVFVPDKEVDKK